MYKITIVNAGVENFRITQYCVVAASYKAAGEIALAISGTDHNIYVVDI